MFNEIIQEMKKSKTLRTFAAYFFHMHKSYCRIKQKREQNRFLLNSQKLNTPKTKFLIPKSEFKAFALPLGSPSKQMT
ncbi:CLUMA_CG003348, isoform A [Clunio marinus]|uniref:CLUMA_CG003348, isoform A n=1 Tax=Clunio marinus TaxID=568069 RepID=A0A1J1HQ71_9DIPT|nr:CLUMA_CG003348, isoform A [Clunio marinus]